MDITYPFSKVFIDNTNKLNVFFCDNENVTTFKQLGSIGDGIVDFCELNFSEAVAKIKALETVEVTSANFEDIKKVFWEAVDTLKDKHSYVHFFLNADLLRNFYIGQKTEAEKFDYATFIFQYYINLQYDYSKALEMCLSNEVLPDYTLSERYLMFCNLNPNFTHHTLRSKYAIAPIAEGKFDTSKLISFSDPSEVDTRKVLKNIHRDSEHAVSLWQYFAVQSLEEMLYLEFAEMVKRGIRIKRCGLCDKYFVLADKRKRDYCNRIYKDNRTCKQIGAKQKFNKAMEQDRFLQEFQTIYNRMYSRYYRFDAWDSDRETNKITEAEFKQWSNAASDVRSAYKEGKISGEEMVEVLNKSTQY